jgi:hypothetical protein
MDLKQNKFNQGLPLIPHISIHHEDFHQCQTLINVTIVKTFSMWVSARYKSLPTFGSYRNFVTPDKDSEQPNTLANGLSETWTAIVRFEVLTRSEYDFM